METKTPTLEEVKEYFKNAKEVKCLCNGEIYSTKAMIEDFYYHESNGWWFDVLLFEDTRMDVFVWDELENKFAEIISYKEQPIDGGSCINDFKTPKHYDNSKGSIYQFCENQNLNSYEFDIIKRVVRSRKKGNFKEDLEKTKHLIDLYLKEYENNRNA